MLKKLSLIIFLISALAATAFAQNTNSSTTQTRSRTSTNAKATQPSNIEEQGTAQEGEASNQNAARARRSRGRQSGAQDPGAKGVLAAFEALIEGIRNADVEAVTAAYWNSAQLILFNNNGTVTKGWEQMRKNRESSYPDLKDVKLETRDVRVSMLGRDGAVVTCLWTQSQSFRGAQETATGRMTLVFRRVGNSWKAVHLHTSPDAPDPSRVMPSEQTQQQAPVPKPSPAKARP